MEAMKSLWRFIRVPLIQSMADTLDPISDDLALLFIALDRLDGGGNGVDDADDVGRWDGNHDAWGIISNPLGRPYSVAQKSSEKLQQYNSP